MGNAGKLLATFLVYYAVSCIAPTIPLNAEQQHTAWGEQKPLQVYAHRGGAGMHAESTLYSFAYAIDIGADVVEMDTLFTKDGIPVVWHDFAVEADKCFDTVPGAKYVGQFIANLTLAELKTLDCGSQQSEGHLQAKLYPGAQIQTLEEVLDFIKCYSNGNDEIQISLETKVDIRFPTWTPPVEVFIDNIVPVLKKHGMFERTVLQSFDWRSIVGIKEKFPDARVGALIDETLVDMVEDIWGMDWVTAAHALGAEMVSPHHGSLNSNGEYGGTISQRDYVPFTTKELVEKAHALGMMVIPWTVDDETTIEKVILDGVDGIISNYPLRVGWVATHLGCAPGIRPGPIKPPPLTAARCFAKADLLVHQGTP